MPLIVLCGIPASGKSTRAAEIASHLQGQGLEVEIITAPESTPQEVYTVSRLEKDLRTSLKSAVERSLAPNRTVILDWLNYIKGYRYELFCLARNVQTTMTVVYCEIEVDAAVSRGKWPEDLCRDLASRMEVPNPKNRWDSPLFSLRPDEPTPVEDITRAALEGKLPRPPVATKTSEPVQGDYLYILDQISQQVAADILEAQSTYPEGAQVTLRLSQASYQINRAISELELKRARTQFVKMNRLRPCPAASLAAAFADYIQNSHSDAF